MRFHILAAFLGGLLLVSSGCGGGSSEKLGSVSGQVLLKDGRAPDEGLVNLYAPATGDSAQAALDPNGKFLLKRVPVGEYQVSITPPVELPPGDPNYVQRPASRIPTKYYSASTSGLSVTVKPGENSLDLHLE